MREKRKEKKKEKPFAHSVQTSRNSAYSIREEREMCT